MRVKILSIAVALAVLCSATLAAAGETPNRGSRFRNRSLVWQSAQLEAADTSGERGERSVR
jgi:hypothetical protein